LPGAPAELEASSLRRYNQLHMLERQIAHRLARWPARIAFITAGRDTQMVGSPTPPQKS